MIALRCTWRTCHQSGPWTITAGKPAAVERVEFEPERPTVEVVPLWLDGGRSRPPTRLNAGRPLTEPT